MTGEAPAFGPVPIGRPIANTQIYILDEGLQLLPSGVPGELYIGGAGLARGYLNRPGLTAEKFIPNPFSSEGGARLYRTGDLARWLPDGTLEFLGRADTQVKVRGYRIELGEIESVLLGHDGVREAVVVALDDASASKRLVSYVVAEADVHMDNATFVAALRERLQEQLPGYMVPSALMVLERLPLTANGKVDRKALPIPGASSQVTYAPPEGLTEELLAQLWQELLGVERVSRYDNFFELGGHSLLVTQLRTRIRTSFQTELPIQDLFHKRTLQEQAVVIESLRKATAHRAKVQSSEIRRRFEETREALAVTVGALDVGEI
jgi:hypothetical protein